MKKLELLAKTFADYKIFPSHCYMDKSPVRVFQNFFPNDHYTKGIDYFLSYNNYPQTKRGADLPWWGKDYFSTETGRRIMIVSQDSLAQDAGSIVFFAHLMPHIQCKVDYEHYLKQLNKNQTFRFNSWNRIKKQLIDWGIDFNFIYVTDAAKVYQEGSWKSFDRLKSKELLESEIDICSPDLLILLGASPLKLLSKNLNYSNAIESQEYILIKDRKAVLTPFPSGNGLTQKNFKQRMIGATVLIKSSFRKQSTNFT